MSGWNVGTILAGTIGGLGIFVALAALVTGDAKAETDDQGTSDGGGDGLLTDEGGLQAVRNYALALVKLGMPAEVVPLIVFQAYTESRGNPLVGLGVPGPRWPPYARPNLKAPESSQRAETRAAERGYRNNDTTAKKQWVRRSPVPALHWQFGSGGLYGLLPTSALYGIRSTDAFRSGEVGPWDVFDPWVATVLYADYVRRVMALPHFKNLPRQHQNLLAVKRAGAALTFIKDYAEREKKSQAIRRKMKRAAAAFGLSESVFTKPLSTDWSGWDTIAAIRAEGQA